MLCRGDCISSLCSLRARYEREVKAKAKEAADLKAAQLAKRAADAEAAAAKIEVCGMGWDGGGYWRG